jgi:hypothetical protein
MGRAMADHFSMLRWLPALALGATLGGCAGPAVKRQEPITPAPPQPVPVVRDAPARPAAPPKVTEGPGKLPDNVLSGVKPDVKPATHAEPPPGADRLVPSPKSGPLRTLHRQAEQRYASLDGYLVRLRRRELVDGRSLPEEIILLKVRREPWAIYMKWLGQESKGRELTWARGRGGDQVHILAAPGGKRSAAPADSAAALGRRHPVTEVGVSAHIERFGRVLDAVERGDGRLGTLRPLGPIRRREFGQPVEAVMQTIPPGAERALPSGGQRFWFFDPQVRLPVLIVTQDPDNNDVEYYCYDQFHFPAAAYRDDEFDPDRLWSR